MKLFIGIFFGILTLLGQDLVVYPTPHQPLTVEEKVVAAEAFRIHKGTWTYAEKTNKVLTQTQAWTNYQKNLEKQKTKVGKTLAGGTGVCGLILAVGLTKYGSYAQPTTLLCLGVTGAAAGSMLLNAERQAWEEVTAPDKKLAGQLIADLEFQAEIIRDARKTYNTITWNSDLPKNWPQRLDLFQIH